MKKLYSTGEVARILGVPQHRIVYAITTKKVTEAKVHFVGKRCFGYHDLREIARHFGVALPSKEDGHVSV
jgi:DNA-binding transcriptional MerR regulator